MSKVPNNHEAGTDHPRVPQALTSEHSNGPDCDHVHRRVVRLVDPMKSFKTAGWLRGELRAPMQGVAIFGFDAACWRGFARGYSNSQASLGVSWRTGRPLAVHELADMFGRGDNRCAQHWKNSPQLPMISRSTERL